MFSIIEGSVPKGAVYKPNPHSKAGPSLSYKDSMGRPQEMEFKYSVISMSVKPTRHEWKTVTLNLFDKTKIVADVDDETLLQIRAAVEKKREAKKKQDSRLPTIMGATFVGIIAAVLILYKPSQSTSPLVASPTVQASAPLTVEDSNKAIRNDIMNQINNASDLLAGAEIDLRQGRMKTLDARSLGAMLEVINLNARALQSAWHGKDKLEPVDVKRVQSIEARLATFQQRALPQMRLSYKKAADATLWEHDATVVISGAGNTVLSFYGYFFALNANIKAAEEQVEELTTHLRFKKLQFASFRYAPTGTAYALQTPSDGVVATFDNGTFTKIDHGPRKP